MCGAKTPPGDEQKLPGRGPAVWKLLTENSLAPGKAGDGLRAVLALPKAQVDVVAQGKGETESIWSLYDGLF